MHVIEIDIPVKIKTIELIKATIWIREISLFDFAIIDVRLVDSNGSIHDMLSYKLEGQDYLDWKDDQYLIDWIKLRLNASNNT